MDFGELIDRIIEPFSPRVAARRAVARIGLREVRQYDAAQPSRRTAGWRRPATSADAEVGRGLVALRNSGREIARNNKYGDAATLQGVAHMVGDGIVARAVHTDLKVASVAQDAWDGWADSPVHEGVNNHYHVQKLIAGGLMESGEMLQVWRPSDTEPNAEIDVFEGDYLDHNKTEKTSDGRIVQGVQFRRNKRIGYWMFDEHPGDTLFGAKNTSSFVPLELVDHVFDQRRAQQTRGISWFASTALDLRDIADIEGAMHLKKKIETYLGLVLSPPDNGGTASPLAPKQDEQGPGRAKRETMEAGMIFRAQAGETVNVVNPSSSGDTVAWVKQQLAAVSAVLVPYHLMTGDVTGANYTSLRAALLGFGARLDVIQQQIIIPKVCDSAFRRRMAVLALKTGDKRFLQVKAQWAVPSRALLDPVKDLMGEILAIRAGLVTLTSALAKRGIDVDKQLAEIARIDALLDKLGLALDTDPRRVTSAGILQEAQGYLRPKGEDVPN